MQTIDETVIQPLERGLVKIGINSAGKAGVFFAVLTAGSLFVLKPSAMFDQTTGRPRQWSAFGDAVNPTPVPWWLASAGIGWGLSLII